MKLRLLLAEESPPRLVDELFLALPPPLAPGEVVPFARPLGPCYERSRAQHDAVSVLALVPEPEPLCVNLLLTGVDLFVPALTYVFGLSHLGGRRGILSLARLRPERTGDTRTLLGRLRVEVLHEAGHALGLVHCPVHDCAMHRSLWPESIDLKKPELCASCRAILDPPSVLSGR